MPQAPETLPPYFFDKQAIAPAELPSDFFDKPTLKPKTPQETKQFLQGRYGDILKRNSDPSEVNKQALIGAGKGVLSQAGSMLGPLTATYDTAEDIYTGLKKKPLVNPLTTPKGEVQQAGSELSGLLQLLLPSAKPIVQEAAPLVGRATNATGRIIKGAAQGALEEKNLTQGGAGATIGGGLGYLIHGPEGAKVGAEIGGGLPFLRGAVKGAIKGYRNVQEAVDKLSNVSQRKLAHMLFEEVHGKPPGNAQESIQAVREMKEAARAAKPPKPPLPGKGTGTKSGGAVSEADLGIGTTRPGKPVRRGINRAMEPDKPGELLEGQMFPEAKVKPTLRRKGMTEGPVKPTPAPGKGGSGFDTGSEPSVSSIKHEARHTDAMRAVFANARNLGVDSKALRAAAKEFYGKGISEMTYEEVVDLNERLLTQKAVPKK